MKEEEIIENLQKGINTDEAFRALISEHKIRLYWHIRTIVKIHEDADDVLQNTFIKVFKNVKSFKGDSKLFSWMYRIATNESITFLNKKSKKLKLSDQELNDYLLETLESDVYFEGSEIQLQLQKAIEALPQQQKIVFNMRYFEEIPYEEMSEILDSSVGALKSNYHHARKKVEKFLKSD